MMISRITLRLTTFLFTIVLIIIDARSLPGKLQKKKSKSFVVVDRFALENVPPKDAWEVNQGLNSTFFEGDIVLTADMLKLLNATSSTRRRRAIKKDPNARWKNGVVPFVIDKRLKHSAKLKIRRAIRRWRKHTCIKFHKKLSNDVDWLRFVAEDG
ncbi:zinc metallo ase nas-4-like [Paramuricea clavata]|uniref:Zinc metallo ase nas-4-like n=1 Tax=Paramuricea clavata TaxID=317549 RepID=A0A7D9KYF3_PARCT|nr:zinc metallo ase nas-4-like [Paramuricea clavata]